MIITKTMIVIIFLIFSCILSQSSANETCKESFLNEFEWHEYNLSFNFPCPKEELEFDPGEIYLSSEGEMMLSASISRYNDKKFLFLDLKEIDIPKYHQIPDEKNLSEINLLISRNGYPSACKNCSINGYLSFCGVGYNSIKRFSTNFTRIWMPGIPNPQMTIQIDIHPDMPIYKTRSESVISEDDFNCFLGSLKITRRKTYEP